MISIFPHEMNALLEALRRDLRRERQKACINPNEADIHRANARLGVRLLDALNPRSPDRAGHRPSQRNAEPQIIDSSPVTSAAARMG